MVDLSCIKDEFKSVKLSLPSALDTLSLPPEEDPLLKPYIYASLPTASLT